MKNINVCLLAAVACVYPIQVSANPLDNNLNFVLENNVYSLHSSSVALHTVIPLELKPILSFNSGIKLAAVCSLGGGGCSGLGFSSGDNNINLDNEALCKEQGYMLSGNCVDGATKNDLCPYNEAFFKSCICDTTRYTQSGAYTGQCGTLADVNTCTASDESKYYHCNCDISFVTKCNSSNQYIVSGAEVCLDSQNGDYIANAGCKTCNLPAIVNSAKNNCTCPSNYITCGTNQNGIGTVCTADGGNKYSSCECPVAWVACNTTNNEVGTGLSCILDGITKFESCGCPTSYKTCNSANNEVEIGKSCTIGGITKFENCSCPSNFVTCNKGGEVGAKKCTLNGTEYWSQCKPELTPAQICRQKLATHSSASGYTPYLPGTSQSMGKGFIIIDDVSVTSLPGTKIFGASYFSQIPECAGLEPKLILVGEVEGTKVLNTVDSLNLYNINIVMNATIKSDSYATAVGILIRGKESYNNVLSNVKFSTMMKDYSYSYLRMGDQSSTGDYPNYVYGAAGRSSIDFYGNIVMEGQFGQTNSFFGTVNLMPGSKFEATYFHIPGSWGGLLKMNNATLTVDKLQLYGANVKFDAAGKRYNTPQYPSVVMDNGSQIYVKDYMHTESAQIDVLNGSELNLKLHQSYFGAPISLRGNNSKFNFWNPINNSKTNVKTSTSSQKCGAAYNTGSGCYYKYDSATISKQLNGWRCCTSGNDLCGAETVPNNVWNSSAGFPYSC